MKRLRFVLVLMAMLLPLVGYCAEGEFTYTPDGSEMILSSEVTNEAGEVFTASVGGVDLVFKVTDSAGRAVQVGEGEAGRVCVSGGDGNALKGRDVEIPSSVEYGGVSYSVTAVGGWAFQDCNNVSIRIPSSVVSIGERAFVNCQNGSVITVAYTDPSVVSVGESAFAYASERNTVLRVPAGTVSLYASASGWSEFKPGNIREIAEGGVRVVSLESAGTLADKIPAEERFSISELTITGPINGTDMRLIREMSGNDYKGQVSDGILERLDLSGARIVSGGEKYLETTQVKASSGNAYGFGSDANLVTRDNEIGDWLFAGCESLKELRLPADVTSVGHGAFAMMKSLRSLALPSSVTRINPGILLSHCSNLSTLTIAGGGPYSSPEGSNAIMRGSELVLGIATTVIPDGTEVIGSDAFNSSAVVGTVTLPSSVKAIGSAAFDNCSALTEVVLPDGLESIGERAFSATGIRSLRIPAGVNSIGSEMVVRCHSLESLSVDGRNGTYDSRDNCNAVILSSENRLLHGCKSTVIPSSVTSIGDNAMADLNHVVRDVELVIPVGVTSIGAGAFRQSSYKSVYSRIARPFAIADNVFADNVYAKELTVPFGCASAYKETAGWSRFASISEYSGPLENGDVFRTKVEGVEMFIKVIDADGNAVQLGEGEAGKPCVSVETADGITIPETVLDYNVTAIGAYAFKGVSAQKSLVIPLGITSIGAYAFAECSALTDVYSKVQKPFAIDASVFSGISTDAVLKVPFGHKALYEAAGWTAAFSKTVVDIDEETSKVESNAVTYELKEEETIEMKEMKADEVNNKIGSVSIAQELVVNDVPVPVTSIAPDAFKEVKDIVTSITIPEKITSIGEFAFAGCKKLEKVLCLNPEPVNLKGVAGARGLLKDGNSGGTVSQFDDVDLGKCTLYVLDGSEQSYKDAAGWNSFGDIKAFAGMGDVNTDKAIDVIDVVGEVNQTLGKASDGFLYGAGDMNADNNIDVSDVVSIVNVILGKSAGARSMMKSSSVAVVETTATDHLSLMSGNEGGLSLVLDNTADYIAAQFDVRLSEGMTLDEVTKGQRARGHQLATAKLGEGVYRVLLYTIGDRTFSGQSGEVVSLGVAGEGSVSVENITFITAGESRKKFDDLSNQLTGIDAVLNDNGERINDKAVWHDLQGHRLETAPTTKGVYLKNGKKVVVK